MSADATPTVEALIVSYETRELLRQTIETLIAHPPRPQVAGLSIAVFDNASADGSADLVQSEWPSVRLVRSGENVGFAAANNRLAATSTASHVLLLNSDVIVIEDIVTPLLRALTADPAAVVAGPRLTFEDGAPQHSSQDFPTLRFEAARALHGTKIGGALRPVFDTGAVISAARQHHLDAEREPRRTGFLWATCWLIARADIADGLFDESYVTYDEDLDFCRRQAERGRSALFVPGAHLIHLGGASSTSDAKAAMMRRGRRRYFDQHQGRAAALAYRYGVEPLSALKRARRDLAGRARVTPSGTG
jgi:hypothetical protein